MKFEPERSRGKAGIRSDTDTLGRSESCHTSPYILPAVGRKLNGVPQPCSLVFLPWPRTECTAKRQPVSFSLSLKIYIRPMFALIPSFSLLTPTHPQLTLSVYTVSSYPPIIATIVVTNITYSLFSTGFTRVFFMFGIFLKMMEKIVLKDLGIDYLDFLSVYYTVKLIIVTFMPPIEPNSSKRGKFKHFITAKKFWADFVRNLKGDSVLTKRRGAAVWERYLLHTAKIVLFSIFQLLV